jgi:hypothetical protein
MKTREQKRLILQSKKEETTGHGRNRIHMQAKAAKTVFFASGLVFGIIGIMGACSSDTVNVAEAKKSYNLIVFLDDAYESGNLPSFKVVDYDSDDKKIYSDKVTPDFSDDLQKISPKSGDKITDKVKQHPKQNDGRI